MTGLRPGTGPDRGWVIATAAAGANAVTFGTLFSFGVFLTPIAHTFGTTTGGVAPLLSGAVLFYYVAGAVAGWASDRFGIRPVVAAGAVALPLGLVLTAAADRLWLVYLCYIPLVGIGAGSCYAPLIGTLGRWFDRRRAAATSLLLVGVGGGTLLGPLVGRELIDRWGWRGTFLAFGLVAAIVLGATAAVVADPPGRGSGSGTAPWTLFRSRRMLVLYLSTIVIGPGFYAPFAFLNDYAVSIGAGGRAAAALLATMGAASLVARLALGVIGDRFPASGLYLAGYGLLALSLIVWLAAGSAYGLLVAAAVIHGIGWAAWVTATPLVFTRWFGTANLGAAVGLFYTGLGVGAVLGPALSGQIIDRVGYRPAVAAVVGPTVVAVVIAAIVLGRGPGRLAGRGPSRRRDGAAGAAVSSGA